MSLSPPTTNTHTHDDAKNDITIFPNPSSGLINLVTDLQLEKVVFYNAAGQIAFVYNGTEQQKINISAVETGVYFAHFRFDNGKTAIKKIIKTWA